MGSVAGIDRAQQMIACRQVKHNTGLALGVQRRARQLPALVADSDGALSGQPILAGHGHLNGSLCAPVLVAGLRAQRGLRGQASRALRGYSQRGHHQCDTQSCNQLKPRIAAENASHVHLLQNSKSDSKSFFVHLP